MLIDKSIEQKIDLLKDLLSKKLLKESFSVSSKDVDKIVNYHRTDIEVKFNNGETPRDLVFEYSEMIHKFVQPLEEKPLT